MAREQWIDAGSKTRVLLDATGVKHATIARRCDMSAPTLSKTLSGRRAATQSDCEAFEQLLAEEGDDYEIGTLTSLWFISDDTPDTSVNEPDTDPAPADAQPDEPDPTPSRTWWVLVAGTLIVVLASWNIWQARQPDAPVGALEQRAVCSPGTGEMADTVPADKRDWAPVIGRTYSNYLPQYNRPCPTDKVRVDLDGNALVQPIADLDGKVGVIIASSAKLGTVVTEQQWISLFAARAAISRAGIDELPTVPLRVEPRRDAVYVPTPEGVLVGQDDEQPHFYLPQLVYDAWRDLGGENSRLGLPLTHPYLDDQGRIATDFENGTITATITAGVIDLPVPSYDRRAALPRQLAQTGGLAVTADGTVWLISRGTRAWVATPQVRSCLGPDAELIDAHGLNDVEPAPTAICE